MASSEQNGEHLEDEAFRKHLRQMLDDGPDTGDVGVSATAQSSQSATSDFSMAPATTVDLNDEPHDDPQPKLTSQSSEDRDSPFQAPDMAMGSSSYGSPYSPSAVPTLQPGTTTTTPAGGSKLDQVKAQVKEFSVDTFRTTKQLFSEMMGKGTRTVDPRVDVALSELRILQATYLKLLEETSNMHSYFSNVIYSQKQMTNIFGELSQRDTKMAEDFHMNAETQRVLVRNGEQLLGAISFFLSNMRTLCNKTIQDCLDTAKKYEAARLQYDTYRTEHEQVIHSGGSSSSRSIEIRQKYETRKQKYEQLKADVVIKMQFLEENKSKVVHRQMMLFHNAIAAYFSGNQKQLETVLSQFSVKLRSPNAEAPSWLEK